MLGAIFSGEKLAPPPSVAFNLSSLTLSLSYHLHQSLSRSISRSSLSLSLSLSLIVSHGQRLICTFWPALHHTCWLKKSRGLRLARLQLGGGPGVGVAKVTGTWSTATNSVIDPSSPTAFDGGSWLHKVPFNLIIIMVPLVRDENGQILKHAF